MKKPLTIIFTGSQGSGKGTQVSFIKEALLAKGEKVVHLDSGGALRELSAGSDGVVAKKIKEGLERGEMSPDMIPIYLLGKKMVDELTPEAHILVDGFPRNALQFGVFDNFLHFVERHRVFVINLNVSEEKVLERLRERGRSDDTDEKITRRLGWYKSMVLPLLAIFRSSQRYLVIDIDANQDIEQVRRDIFELLEL